MAADEYQERRNPQDLKFLSELSVLVPVDLNDNVSFAEQIPDATHEGPHAPTFVAPRTPEVHEDHTL